MKRVVINTNVLVSALLFGGIPGQLVPIWKKREIIPVASRGIIEEYLRVLAYPRFGLTESEIQFLFHREILPWFEVVAAPEGDSYVSGDPGDDMFIWCALAGQAECIISGDEHLLALRSCPVPILSPAQFLKSQKEK